MKDLVIILDNIRSALNVGAIFRTCDGAGVKKIYLVGITPEPTNKKVSKTALGAEEYVQWEYFKEIDTVINKLKAEKYKIFSVEQTPQSKDYYKEKYSSKTAIIFGHEITGVSTTALNNSDEFLSIPMNGKKNSLNVATCVGILSYYIIFSS